MPEAVPTTPTTEAPAEPTPDVAAPVPEVTPAPTTDTPPVESPSQDTPTPGENADLSDDDLLAAIEGESKPALSPEELTEFQAWKAAKAQQPPAPAPAPIPEPAPAPTPPAAMVPLEISDEEFDEAVTSKEAFTKVLTRAIQGGSQATAQNIVQARLEQVVPALYKDVMGQMEAMIHLNEVRKENPEINLYPKAFSRALGIEMAKNPKVFIGDNIDAAVKVLKENAQKAEKIRKSGKRVDVREAQTPPKGSVGGARDATGRFAANDPTLKMLDRLFKGGA